MPDQPTRKTHRDSTLLGLRKLCDEQTPGREYSVQEIAAACECDPNNIRILEKRALKRVRRRLQGVAAQHGLHIKEAK